MIPTIAALTGADEFFRVPREQRYPVPAATHDAKLLPCVLDAPRRLSLVMPARTNLSFCTERMAITAPSCGTSSAHAVRAARTPNAIANPMIFNLEKSHAWTFLFSCAN